MTKKHAAIRPVLGEARSLLLRDLARFSRDGFPSLRMLTSVYGISRPTLTAAALQLAREGHLRFTPSGRLSAPDGGCKPAVPASPRGPDKVKALVRRHILESTYRVGYPLPKIHHFVVELGVSSDSVRLALRELAGEGLLHRHGRQWRVGREPQAGPAPARRTVYILARRFFDWHGLENSPRTRSFHGAFTQQAREHQVRLSPVLIDPSGLPPKIPFHSARDFLADLPGRVRQTAGVLIVMARREIEDLGHWVRTLVRLGLPVVWFDRLDEGLPPDLKPHPLFTRCHLSEKAALQAALQAVVAAGHRDMVYIRQGTEAWMDRRLDLLKGEAEKLVPPVRLSAPAPFREPQSWKDPEALARFLSGGRRHFLPAVRQFFRDLHRRLRSRPGLKWAGDADLDRIIAADMVETRDSGWLIPPKIWPWMNFGLHLEPSHFKRPGRHGGDQGVTVLLCPNDRLASLYYAYLSALDFHIPADLSLVSFDNDTLEYWIYPISTVDFGFDHLGYWALHALLRDVELPRNRRGDIRARPRLEDKGSLGAPRLPAGPGSG